MDGTRDGILDGIEEGIPVVSSHVSISLRRSTMILLSTSRATSL